MEGELTEKNHPEIHVYDGGQNESIIKSDLKNG